MTWSFIAGFFDGEGSLIRHGRGHGYRVIIPQTNLEVLEEIRRFTGSGFIFTVKKRKAHWKESWVYGIAKQSDVVVFLKNIQKHVIVKRNSVDTAIPLIEKRLKELNEERRSLQIRIIAAYKMRGKGATYRAIGRYLHVDFGYIRRMMKRHPEYNGGRSSMAEHRVVVPRVAGSNPVAHPLKSGS